MNPMSNLLILDENQLKAANKDQLITLFNQIENAKKIMEQQLLDTQVQLNTRQNEFDILSKEIQEKFGVNSVEELESLKQTKVLELAQIGQELKTEVNNSGETNG